LLVFNKTNSVNFKELKEIIQICTKNIFALNLFYFNSILEELKKTLFSLFYMKEKVLKKSGNVISAYNLDKSSNLYKQKSIEENDEFTLNLEYSSKVKMIKINQLQKKETVNFLTVLMSF